jgi:hypothetical protein
MDTRPFALGIAIVVFPICWLCERYLGFGAKAKALAVGAMSLFGSYFALIIAYLVVTSSVVGVLRLFGINISSKKVATTVLWTGAIALHVGAFAVLIYVLRGLR